ncbi:hypothetical protein F5B22DRAFT_190029 [Xylaria bambusicola]|uniref:uncharacterized protein n=1 Tax=Xylaria bambusicola TaxID=326684 RepID=UPI0020085827|nr:uncharacterized protein F5B22DRAFT_190029 [Xylaria bambusicola]KAI0515433.1 hypothetical protein F5B22DRAFT_190029 [Xylaria bambusicola]
MQVIDKDCSIHCRYPRSGRIVYSTDPTACPTFLHLHDDRGYCMPDTISTSSLIIKHRASTTNSWEYFYVTSDLRQPVGHGAGDTQKFRPMRIGRCVPVGMKAFYPDTYRRSECQQTIELVHIHKQENESQEAFNSRMTNKSFTQRPPVLLHDLYLEVAKISEVQEVYKNWRASKPEERIPSFTIERYQATWYMGTGFSAYGKAEHYHWRIPLENPNPNITRLSGSDNGSLVFEWGKETGKAGKPIGKILGIVESMSTWSQEDDHAIVVPMINVVDDLMKRFHSLFPPPKAARRA